MDIDGWIVIAKLALQMIMMMIMIMIVMVMIVMMMMMVMMAMMMMIMMMMAMMIMMMMMMMMIVMVMIVMVMTLMMMTVMMMTMMMMMTTMMMMIYGLSTAYIGAENVMVIISDDLRTDNPPEKFERAYQSVLSFIGVCPYSIKGILTVAQHHSRASVDDVPTSSEISREMYQRLTVFFRPINNYLMKLVEGVDLEAWNEQQPPSHLAARYKMRSKELEPTILTLARIGDIVSLEKELLATGGDGGERSVDVRSREGRTALMIATIHQQIPAVRLVSELVSSY